MLKIAFIQKRACETISIMVLSAILKQKGYHTEVFIADIEEDIYKAIFDFNPVIVAYSLYNRRRRFCAKNLSEN